MRETRLDGLYDEEEGLVLLWQNSDNLFYARVFKNISQIGFLRWEIIESNAGGVDYKNLSKTISSVDDFKP